MRMSDKKMMVSVEHKRLIDSLDSRIDVDFEFKKRTEILVKAIPFGASIYQK